MRNDKVVNSSQAHKDRAFDMHILVESLCILRKNAVINFSSASGLFLTFS